MKSRSVLMFLAVFGFLGTAFASMSPVGYWKTIDDHTGQAKSVVQIWQVKECAQNDPSDCVEMLKGKIVKILKYDANNPKGICLTCTGAQKDRSLINMTIMQNMYQRGNEWRGGKIFDPVSGNHYKCTLKLEDNGAKLKVHGYIGIPLFGRTQVWIRQAKI